MPADDTRRAWSTIALPACCHAPAARVTSLPTMDVLEAIKTRASTRAFLDREVDPTTVDSILDAARWAPSGVNTQPWQVVVVSGATKQVLGDAIVSTRIEGVPPEPDYRYYPGRWREPYQTRRHECGMALYGALDIQREDKQRRREVWGANYRFFDAPLGLLFLLDRNLETGSWIDTGMFV